MNVEDVDKHVARQYEVAQKLGKGAYGIVWKATDKKAQKTVALKKIYHPPAPPRALPTPAAGRRDGNAPRAERDGFTT